MKKLKAVSGLIAVCSCLASAANVYVVPPGTPGVTPDGVYQSWGTAATNIQDAIDAIDIADGNIVYVTNGIYLLPDQILVNKAVELRSWKDGELAPEETILDGNNYEGKPVTNRVMYASATGAIISGFTIRNGYSLDTTYGGGGVRMLGCALQDCHVIDNYSANSGGGVYYNSSSASMKRCLIKNNIANGHGPGIAATQGRVEDCVIINNRTSREDNTGFYGAGAYVSTGCVLARSYIAHNSGSYRGGGVYANREAEISYCVIEHNAAVDIGGGLYTCYTNTIYNCLITENYAPTGGGVAMRYTSKGKFINCTIANNSANSQGGGIRVWETAVADTMINCIVYDNTVSSGTYSNLGGSSGSLVWENSCIAPTASLTGSGLIDEDPLWVDFAESNYRLRPDSPCLNAGVLQAGMENEKDLDGNHRIDKFTRKVDLGCYEHIFQGMFMHIK